MQHTAGELGTLLRQRRRQDERTIRRVITSIFQPPDAAVREEFRILHVRVTRQGREGAEALLGPVDQYLALVRRRQFGPPGCFRSLLHLRHSRQHLVQRLRLQFLHRRVRPALQVARRAALLALLLRHRDVEPLLQRRVDALPLNRPDVRAVARLRVVDLDLPGPGCEAQVVGRVVEAPHLLVALPDRVAVAVPGELVGVDHPPRGHARHDHPRQEPVAAAESRRFRVDSQLPLPA